MDISVRSVLTAGISAMTATAVVAAPAITAPAPAAPAVWRQVENTATVTSIAPTLLNPSPPPAPGAIVAPTNAASNVIESVYAISRYWANYASLQLAPWALGWIPFGYLISDQIFIWYPGAGWQPGFVLPITDSFVYDFLVPVVNAPLNLGAWIDGLGAIGNATVNGVIGGINNEIRYALSLDWLPFPLPPFPFAANQQAQLTVGPLAYPTAAGTPLDALTAPLHEGLEALYTPVRTLAQAAQDIVPSLMALAAVPVVGSAAALTGAHLRLLANLDDEFVTALGHALIDLPGHLLNLDPQTPVDEIAGLLRDNSDRIVAAGLQYAADLASAVPGLVRGVGADPFATPAATSTTLVHERIDDGRSFVDVDLPRQQLDRVVNQAAVPAPNEKPERLTTADPTETFEQLEQTEAFAQTIRTEPGDETKRVDLTEQVDAAGSSEPAQQPETPGKKGWQREDRTSRMASKKALAEANEAGGESATKVTGSVGEPAKSRRDGVPTAADSLTDRADARAGESRSVDATGDRPGETRSLDATGAGKAGGDTSDEAPSD